MMISMPVWISRLNWKTLYTGILEGLKVFAFYLAVLSLFRGFFIAWMAPYMGPGTGGMISFSRYGAASASRCRRLVP